MEYYNLKSQDKFESFYRDKVNQLLLRSDVMSYLDTKKVYFNGIIEVNLFPNYDRKKFINLTLFNDTKSFKNSSKPKSLLKINDLNFKSQIERDLNRLKRNIKQFNYCITKNIIQQSIKFEEKKREKQSEKKTILFDYQLNYKIANNELHKRLLLYSLMLNEIQEYVGKNMNEMYKALDELKQSYEQEIKEVEESGYPGVSSGLKEDLNVELDNLKLLYEEQRIKQTEIIRERYLKIK